MAQHAGSRPKRPGASLWLTCSSRSRRPRSSPTSRLSLRALSASSSASRTRTAQSSGESGPGPGASWSWLPRARPTLTCHAENAGAGGASWGALGARAPVGTQHLAAGAAAGEAARSVETAVRAQGEAGPAFIHVWLQERGGSKAVGTGPGSARAPSGTQLRTHPRGSAFRPNPARTRTGPAQRRHLRSGRAWRRRLQRVVGGGSDSSPPRGSPTPPAWQASPAGPGGPDLTFTGERPRVSLLPALAAHGVGLLHLPPHLPPRHAVRGPVTRRQVQARMQVPVEVLGGLERPRSPSSPLTCRYCRCAFQRTRSGRACTPAGCRTRCSAVGPPASAWSRPPVCIHTRRGGGRLNGPGLWKPGARFPQQPRRLAQKVTASPPNSFCLL